MVVHGGGNNGGKLVHPNRALSRSALPLRHVIAWRVAPLRTKSPRNLYIRIWRFSNACMLDSHTAWESVQSAAIGRFRYELASFC